MKNLFTLALCAVWVPVSALALNGESKQEAKLFKSFLSSVYALRENDKKALSRLEKTLSLAPDSKYLKR
ncbi:MAG: hypothetical protein ACI351_07150, partial [Candidatus Avelusimicrobium sp.]|uniref:hypothetical protein n=1 Tax=Candidatus Avelusimicrobium sp. TaxID=3048833 RepID=UPI003F0D2BAA